MAQNHAMPSELKRLGKGEYEVRGTRLQIVQGDKKWTVTGHSEDLGAFGSRGAALGKLQELGLVPEVPAEQPKPEAEKPTVLDPGDASGASGASGANGSTGEAKRRPRKPRAKVAAKV
jgi:hypothetical protein